MDGSRRPVRAGEAMTESLLRFVGSAVAAAVLTGAFRWFAMRGRLLDYPNPRSAHDEPVPLGGGVGIVLACFPFLLLAPIGEGAAGIIAAGAGAVALVGFIDDRRGTPKWVRLLIHVIAVCALVVATGNLGPLELPGLPTGSLVASVVMAVALVWLINLYNFMDGIDGLAATETIFVSLGLALCLHLGGSPSPGLLAIYLVTAGSSLGFLLWNWPPARIFMGDVGSGFLGFLIGVLAMVAHRQGALSLWVPAILLAVFVSDTTVTLLRRMIRGEKWHEAHRLHGYQWLSRRLGSHGTVTVLVSGVNVLWLAPNAVAAVLLPQHAGLFALLAYIPVIAGVIAAGAGRSE
jgi:Fuc2NAc and GlcNAc transferase